MTELHKSVIEAALGNEPPFPLNERLAAERARRVLRAQAQPEAIPDEAIVALQMEILRGGGEPPDDHVARAAFSAALLHIAGGNK